jgi:hypothetical protein
MQVWLSPYPSTSVLLFLPPPSLPLPPSTVTQLDLPENPQEKVLERVPALEM